MRSALFMLCSILSCAAQTLELPAPSTPALVAARDLLAGGDAWEAVRVLRRQPAGSEQRLWLGLAYYMARQYKLFEQTMRGASPESPFPPYALGRYYLDVLQQADKARAEFAEAVRRSPAHAPALYHLGWCDELAGKLDDAWTLYSRASGYWLAHVGMARISLARDDTTAAKQAIERAVALKPDAAKARLLYGRVLERAGETAGALEQFERAAELDAADSSALYQAARCARNLGLGAREKQLLARYRAVVEIYGPPN